MPDLTMRLRVSLTDIATGNVRETQYNLIDSQADTDRLSRMVADVLGMVVELTAANAAAQTNQKVITL